MMSGTILELMETIEDLMSETDAIDCQKEVQRVLQARQNGREWVASQEGKDARSMGEWTYYAKAYTAFGGKTIFNLVQGRGVADITEIVTKRHQASCDARNARIAAKLTAKGITDIAEIDSLYGQASFSGRYSCRDGSGVQRLIKIDTILAGGPVQCLHNRVLVKIL